MTKKQFQKQVNKTVEDVFKEVGLRISHVIESGAIDIDSEEKGVYGLTKVVVADAFRTASESIKPKAKKTTQQYENLMKI